MKRFTHIALLALTLMAAPVTAETSVPADARSVSSLRPYSGIFSYTALSPVRIETEGFALKTDSGSLKYDIDIRVTKLPYKGGTAMRSNMVNVSAHSDGIRLLPNGEHFSEASPALITLSYDPDRLPVGYQPKDIYTYYCDDGRNWFRLERVSVDTAAHTITSYTTHFTDFANAVIKVPEMPESKAFVPTAMTDLPDADPMHGIPMIEVPTPNNKGTAELTYPIELPKGRRGLQPNVDLHYSSAGGNGILGVGWSLSTPAITIDTRWGVPRYNLLYETEQYLVNGATVLLRNQDGTAIALPYQDSIFQERQKGIVRFSARDTKNQDLVHRIGTDPTNYWWAVTDKNGVVTYYGRKFDPKHPEDESLDDNSIVKTTSGSIAYWAATASIDAYGNYIKYTNEKKGNTIYVRQIDYTGNIYYKIDPSFRVCMSYKDRSDQSSSGRLGVLQTTGSLLCHLLVQYHDPGRKEPDYTDNIAAYFMRYSGPSEQTLFKSRLEEVVMLDSVHDLILDDVCDLDDIIKEFDKRNLLSDDWIAEAQAEGRYVLAEEIIRAVREPYGASIPASTTRFSYASAPVTSQLFKPAVALANSNGKELSSNQSRSWGIGGTATVGFGPDIVTTLLSGGGNYDFSQSKGECKSMLMDLNGDGLTDIVYEQNGSVWYCKQYKNDDNYGFENARLVPGLTRLSREVSDTHTWGLQLSFGADFSYSNPITTSYTDTYFSDVNGDGLPDMIDGDKILINHLDHNNPSFEAFTGVEHKTISVHNNYCHSIILDGEVDEHLECELREIPVISYPKQSVFGSMPTYGFGHDAVIDSLLDYPDIEYSKDEPVIIPDQEAIFHEIDAFTGHTLDIPDFEYPRNSNGAKSGIQWNDSLIYRIEGNNVVGYRLEYVCVPVKVDPDIETVRVWAAPHSGTVIITDTISLLNVPTLSRAQSRTADGVSYSIQLCDSITSDDGIHLHANSYTLLHQGEIVANDTITPHEWSESVTVKQGDLLLFRLRSGENNRYDRTSWRHSIRYSDESQIYDSQRDFICTGDGSFQAYQAGDVVLTFSGSNAGTDPVVLGVRHNQSSQFLYKDTLQHGVVNISRPLFHMAARDSLIITLEPLNNSVPEPRWSDIHIIPHLQYISDFTTDSIGTTVHDTVSYYPDVRIAHSSNYTPSSPYRTLFGPMHKGWGAFAYQNLNNNNIIVLDSLVNTQRLLANNLAHNSADSLRYSTYTPNISHRDSISNDSLLSEIDNVFAESEVYNPIAESNYWVPMKADCHTEQWIAYGNMGCIGKTLHSNAREVTMQDTIEEIVEYDSAIPFKEGEERVNNFVRKKTQSIQHSISAGAIFYNESFSFGSYNAVVDYMDMNGDGYPDFVGKEGIQYSMPWGGIGKLEKVDNFTPFRSTNDAAGIAFSACPIKEEKSIGNGIRDGKFHLNASMGASMGKGNTHTRTQYADVNADGLPDKINVDSNTVRYNLGYSFSAPRPFGAVVSEGSNVNGGFNANISSAIEGILSFKDSKAFSLGQVSISGGVGKSISSNETNELLVDINGDGLPDRIRAFDNNIIKVAYNRGNNNYSQWKELSNISSISNDETECVTSTLGVTGGVAFLCVKLNFGVQATPFGLSSSHGKSMLTDMDGDGYVDYVYKNTNSGAIYVCYNRIGKANLLTAIENPTGQTIYLDYSLSEPSSAHKSRQWNMTNIVSQAPVHPMQILQSDTIEIRYSYPYYDNYEKTDYGYNYVRTEELGKKINRSIYNNRSLLQNGELEEDELMDEDGHMYIYRQHGSRYRDIATDSIINGEDAICDDANYRVLEDGYWTEYYEGESEPTITTRYNIQYDQYHNIVEYLDEGDISTPADDWRQVITYLDNNVNNMVSLPKTEKVYNSSGQLLRSSWVNYNQLGSPAHIHFEDSIHHAVATTHIAYDTLGNIVFVIAPEDINHLNNWYMFSYDTVTYSNVVCIDNPHKCRTYTTYDYCWGLPKKIIDPAGNEMHFMYDYKGRVETVRTPIELSRGNDYSVKYSYYLFQHNLVVPDTLKYTYVKKEMYDSLFVQQEVTIYDAYGRTLQKKHYAEVDGSNTWVVDGAEEWDAFGRVIACEYPFVAQRLPYEYEPMNPTHAIVQTSYDIMDRPLIQTNADGSTKNIFYFFEKDSMGIDRFLTQITDENGIRTKVLKSPQDWVIQQEAGDSSITFFEYSPIGELLHSTDADGYQTSYQYDMFGRLQSRFHPDAGETKMEYDLAGNLLRKQTANLYQTNDTIEYTYDYGRLKEISYPHHVENNVTFQYDSAGRVAIRQDGTGSEEFVYDPMGNVAQSVRRVVIPTEKQAYVFRTLFKYDSFGRMRNIVYPDGEVVHYGYTTGGLLWNVAGWKQGHTNVYLWGRIYDEQGRKTYQIDGNDVWTKYVYNPQRQWLDSMYTELPDYNVLQDLAYRYDSVGNIISISQIAHSLPTSSIDLGGPYTNTYTYDRQYRLIQSNGNDYFPYSFNATYSHAGRMGNKNTQAYHLQNNLLFGYDKARMTHQPRTIYDFDAAENAAMFWDRNGNLAQIISCTQNSARLHEWDEENRLRFVLGDSYAGYYGYDANGERVYKLIGTNTTSQLNSANPYAEVFFDDAVLYPNPYMVITPKGYTKHYYAGTERLATVIGRGGFSDLITPIETLSSQEVDDIVNPFYTHYGHHTYDPFYYEDALSSVVVTENIAGIQQQDLQYQCQPIALEFVEALAANDILINAIYDNEQVNDIETEIYFYHGDHLGSANWITDAYGEAIQYIHYAPYGELIDNQMSYLYDERYKFTGKERDWESGYDFFGARFLWGAIGHWLSVDPLADKYLHISPYAYCSWNPINKIDPDGRDDWSLDIKTGEFQKIGNKGGSTTDYYSVGTYEGEKFSSYSNYEIERGDGAINSFRIQETDKSTISAFHIPETNTSGFILERPGPDTSDSEQSLRIPANQYGLHENQGSRYPGVPRLYLPNEGIGGKFDKRGILIHVGNYPDDSKGCLLPGSSRSKDFVGNSGITLPQITNYVASKKWLVKLNIFNAFK